MDAWIIARILVVGGLVAVPDNREFMHAVSELRDKSALIVHGLHGTLSEEHAYILPYNGIVSP